MMRNFLYLVATAPLCCAQDVAVVKNAPFSAAATTQITQTLADGNKITRTTIAHIARDSEGRTRREQAPDGIAPVVFILDPVAGNAYAIEVASKSVRRIPLPKPVGTAGLPAGKTESLGPQMIDGIQTTGTRLTRTLAAGSVGNERPVDIVVDAWYSDELQTTIMSTTTDPRVGETVYKITDIQRAEPDHALFEIPPDYLVRDEVTQRH